MLNSMMPENLAFMPVEDTVLWCRQNLARNWRELIYLLCPLVAATPYL